MRTRFTFFKEQDFGRVLRFIENIENNDYLPYENVRFQFCKAYHIPSIGLEGGFARTCGIWEDEQGIAALVLTEGGTIFGETFFIFRSEEMKTADQLNRMFTFAEQFTSKVSEDGKYNAYKLCIPDNDKAVMSFAEQRGYQKTDNYERIMIKSYSPHPEPVILPDGFTIQDARTAAPFMTALAHQHSFRYNQKNDGAEKGFASIRQMPGCRPELDLLVLDPEGQPAGLANFWVSEESEIASVEPLGVVWWQRRKGLAKALITEGINRTRELGCRKMSGGDQPFYWDLGFKEEAVSHFWSWRSEE